MQTENSAGLAYRFSCKKHKTSWGKLMSAFFINFSWNNDSLPAHFAWGHSCCCCCSIPFFQSSSSKRLFLTLRTSKVFWMLPALTFHSSVMAFELPSALSCTAISSILPVSSHTMPSPPFPKLLLFWNSEIIKYFSQFSVMSFLLTNLLCISTMTRTVRIPGKPYQSFIFLSFLSFPASHARPLSPALLYPFISYVSWKAREFKWEIALDVGLLKSWQACQ